MKRQHRLKKRATFAYVYRKGERTSQNGLLLLCAKSREGLKIGISVSKKVGNAVTRNRIKRLLREAILPIEDSIDTHYIYVIVAHPSLAECSFAQVKQTVQSAFEKAGKLVC